MKGQVKIILRDSNGEIIKEIEQTNRVFDIPKQIITEMFPLTIQNAAGYSTNLLDATSPGSITKYDIPFLNTIFIRDWFRSIKINDERFEEDNQGNIVDSAYYDWKIPQLVGSDNTTLANTSNYRYVYANTNYSYESNNLKKLYYSWTMPAPADPNNPQKLFDMKSLSLCHYDNVGRNYTFVTPYMMYGSRNYSNYLIYKYGNFYWGSFNYDLRSNNYCCGALAYNPYFKFDTVSSRICYNVKIKVSNSYPAIIPLHNNEIALLSQWDNLISWNEQTGYISGDPRNINPSASDGGNRGDASNYCRFINIIDNEVGDLKRSFCICQFEDIGINSYSSSYGYTRDATQSCYLNIVNAQNRDYLITYSSYDYGTNIAKTSTKLRIYKLPTQAEYDNESFIKYNPCVATKCTETAVDPEKTYYSRTQNWTRKPGYMVDEDHYVYTVVSNPSGNPSTRPYYDIQNEGVDATIIPYIDVDLGTPSLASTQGALIINNRIILGSRIITIDDSDINNISITSVSRVIGNCSNANVSSSISYEGRYQGRVKILPGFEYGLSISNNGGYVNNNKSIVNNFPVWYNTSCMNLSEDIEIKEGNTLTVEYTITAN